LQLALVQQTGHELELVEVTRERRLLVHPVIEGHTAWSSERHALPPPRRYGWSPADAVAAYRATLAGEPQGPSFDVWA